MHPLAGKPAPFSLLPDLPALVSAYYTLRPDPQDPAALVSFGTSGHRGSSLKGTFNEDHILAIVQAICAYRRQAGITGPLYLGKDTHALSEPAQSTALEVLAANGVETMVAADGVFTPTPSVSRAILAWNRGAERIYGWTEAEALALRAPDLVPPDSRADALAEVCRLGQAEELAAHRVQRLTKAGEVLAVWLTASPLFDEHGLVYAVATTERPVTEPTDA